MDLRKRLNDFSDSLSDYPPREHPAGQVADIFNALLAAVKEAHADDPVVAAITPAAKGHQSGNSAMDAGSLIAATDQLVAALPDDGPSVG
jgi:hypothetical protein